jgi:hypothetical protein
MNYRICDVTETWGAWGSGGSRMAEEFAYGSVEGDRLIVRGEVITNIGKGQVSVEVEGR